MEYFEEQGDNTHLLPGLSNDVTLQLICTKLPWRTFHVLSSVNRVWFGAIRSGKINDTRVRCGTAETLAFMECYIPDTDGHRCAMALYSLRDKALYLLPTLPPFQHRKFSLCRRCITIGGKVYILGAMDTEVWVLDVAGQKKWQECASMQTLRRNFGCALFEGKIYIFGGRNKYSQPIDFSEVYDPKVDAWTKISPMKSSRIDHDAWAVGDGVVVRTGYFYDPDPIGLDLDRKYNYWRPVENCRDGMEAYNPAKDSWRTIRPGDFAMYELVGNPSLTLEAFFTAHGRLHSLDFDRKIFVYDLDKSSVQGLHTCSVEIRSNSCNRWGVPFWPDQVLATNDGLLMRGHFCYAPPLKECRLYQSGTTELGIGKKEIVFEEIECSPLVRLVDFSFLQPVQL